MFVLLLSHLEQGFVPLRKCSGRREQNEFQEQWQRSLKTALEVVLKSDLEDVFMVCVLSISNYWIGQKVCYRNVVQKNLNGLFGQPSRVRNFAKCHTQCSSEIGPFQALVFFVVFKKSLISCFREYRILIDHYKMSSSYYMKFQIIQIMFIYILPQFNTKMYFQARHNVAKVLSHITYY